MQNPSQPTTDTARAVMRERDTIHRRGVTVLAHAIHAMTDANKPAAGRSLAERLMAPAQVKAMTELADLARDAAEFAVKATPVAASLLGAPPEMLKATTPTDRASYVMGWNAALTFITTAFARPWVTVTIEQAPPTADEPARAAKSGDRLARLLEELSGARGVMDGIKSLRDIGVEVVEVEGIRSLLGGDGSAPTCAEPDQLLNVIRVRDRGPNAAPAPTWVDHETGAPWEFKAGDVLEERYFPEAGPQGRRLVNRRTGKSAPFAKPGHTWRALFEVVEKVFVCTCNR